MGRVALNEQDEAFIRKQLESGRYGDASEVVRAALRLMEDFEEERDVWLRDDMPSRYEELRRDPSKGIGFDDAKARFEAKYRADFGSL